MKVSLAFAAAYLATAGLVWAGVFHGLDQYAASHWMPYLSPREHRIITFRSLLLPRGEGPAGKFLLILWVYAAAVVPSAAIIAWCAWRGRSLLWPVLWVAGNAVELAGKVIVTRPELFHAGLHVKGFDHSLPSGHTIRSLIVAAAVASTWRAGRWAYAWAFSVPFALVVVGDHAPTDCVAAVFVALALLAFARDATAIDA